MEMFRQVFEVMAVFLINAGHAVSAALDGLTIDHVIAMSVSAISNVTTALQIFCYISSLFFLIKSALSLRNLRSIRHLGDNPTVNNGRGTAATYLMIAVLFAVAPLLVQSRHF